ncbi:MAG: cellulose biosynthesis protein BcsS [Burkholderiales bacterium]|nr:cellulose biosynthesis protein BcsS [Burkholderiales bacterium]MCZ2420013.1 cellulose biosynthesis protein BcsS [Burkholderiales bacterium]
MRLWLDETRYRYDKNGATVRAQERGAEAAAGLGGAGDNSWWAAYLGLRYDHAELSPDDRANDSRGGHLRTKLQAESEQGVGNWRANLGAAYVFGADKYWLRGRMMYPLAPYSLLGVELLRHGGPDYTATQLGGVFSLPLGGRSTALVKGGLRHDENRGSGGYAGIELSLPY